ncbi:DUF4190 domain-containing protein [Streptomyces sp. M41]|uniref:DUF4190 domain-containing protein n=1 Tax=Streptomyces sp. M41 TaxID=3059412 RepID=UPI00374D0111
MSDDERTPRAPDGSQVPGGPAAPQGGGAEGTRTSLDKQPQSSPGDAMPGEPEAPAEVDPWAPPSASGHAPSSAPATPPHPAGPGYTIASQEPPVSPVSPAWSAPSVHDQQTVTSLPSSGVPSPEPRDAVPPASPWTQPSANPFAPPVAPGPYAGPGEPVPPPPIGPEGPGHVPYGYPGGHGYPAAQGAGGYYGWPGVQPMPSNGMGTAGLVLGIISAVIFCLWPVAIVVGVLALIFGAIGRGKARRGEATNPGQALAGIICGAAGVVLALGMLALVIGTTL